VYASLPDAAVPAGWSSVPTSTKEALRDAKALSAYPDAKVRFGVSEFTTAHPENLFLIPRRIDEPWRLLEAVIDEVQPFVAIFLAPLFWQVAPVFYAACRGKSVPVSVLQPRNMALAAQVIKESKADMVVSTPAAATELQTLLADAGMGTAIRAWHLIVPFGERHETPALKADYMIEYHLFPGVPVARLLPNGTIEPLPDYYFELSDTGTCLISSLERHALPLIRYDSGVRLARAGENAFVLA
jgi:hypothetical protein